MEEEEKSHEGHKHHENKAHTKKIESSRDILKKVRENPWIVSTFVLGLLILVLLVLNFTGLIGGSVSEKQAGEKMLSFVQSQTGGEGEISSVASYDDNFYEVTVLLQGQEIPTYVTKDGKYFVPSFTPLDVSDSADKKTTTAEAPKSDKPSVELYVFTYCPYGTQSEKGIIPVVKLLGNKIDFKIRQIGAMHGEHEKIEAERQLCIEKEYPTKFLDYVLNFALSSEIGACGSNATCATPKINALYTKFGISKAKIDTCMKSDGPSMYAAEEANSKSNGVSGSPTVIINGKNVQSGRDSASYLKTICSAFNAAPAECNETLSSSSPSAGFGSSTSGDTSAAQC